MRISRRSLLCALLASFLLLPLQFASAGSATWKSSPASATWLVANNWTPATVPSNPGDVATFGTSMRTTPTLNSSIEVDSIVFSPGASAYTITLLPGNSPVTLLTISGLGVVNDSGQTQNFSINPSGARISEIDFTNGASAGDDVVFTAHPVGSADLGAVFAFFGNSNAGTATFVNETGNTGGGGRFIFHDTATAAAGTFLLNRGVLTPVICTFNDQSSAGSATLQMDRGIMSFFDSATAAQSLITLSGDNSINLFFGATSTAGQATIVGEGSVLSTAGGAVTQFAGSATAGMATFRMEGSPVAGIEGPAVEFIDATTAADATITVEGGTISGGGGGSARFFGAQTSGEEEGSNAGNAVVTAEGAHVDGAAGGYILFSSSGTEAVNSKAANATLIANPGTNGGGGGAIIFQGTPLGGTARIEVFGNGSFDLSQQAFPGLTTGSLEGNGAVFLGARNLTLGTNNLRTLFAGVLQDGGIGGGAHGSITKIGNGTLTLSDANLYTAGTAVSAGTLVISNTAGSGTGTGLVQVSGGTLGGRGTIAGAVTVGTGSGTGAFLAPAAGTTKQATLTIQSGLTFKSDATYTCTFKARGNQSKTDKVIANGVTIESGSSFSLSGTAQGMLTPGTVLTVLSNTAATPIAGTFANLPDGAILTVNGNNFQADYEGGDGNDLKLIVVP